MQCVDLINSLLREYAEKLTERGAIVSSVLDVHDETRGEAKAKVDVSTLDKLAYFSLWGHGSIQAIVVDEKTMQEIYVADFLTEDINQVKDEFAKWIGALVGS
jgi:hypothetical protein